MDAKTGRQKFEEKQGIPAMAYLPHPFTIMSESLLQDIYQLQRERQKL